MNLPTLYEYYTNGGITSALTTNQTEFILNNRNISIYSGAMHYFRVPREYWRDRLRKLRAAGLNTVETYVPWNLHEPEPGLYDFGQSGTEFERFLDIRQFLACAREEDLFAIVRPGPYICAEWEFGGLPSWLLRKRGLVVRSSNHYFMRFVERYFRALLTILTALQFTRGGPIIAFQLENEYGSLRHHDFKYLCNLKRLYKKYGIVEMLFTSDAPSSGNATQLQDILYAGNFQADPESELRILQSYQPGRPLMVMEYWSGWFDHWGEAHYRVRDSDFRYTLETILKFPASVNIYMFHGGTSFGFMNGANIAGHSTDNHAYQPDTNSYDYDAPLAENGDYTPKYYISKQLLSRYNKIRTKLPLMPALIKRKVYKSVEIVEQLSLEELIQQIPYRIYSAVVAPMELIPINNNAGQGYGYIIYRKENIYIRSNSIITIKGHVCDTVMVLINNQLMSKTLDSVSDLNNFGYWRLKDSQLEIVNEYLNATLDFVVENMGRVNFFSLRQFHQFKGLWQGHILLNDKAIVDWLIIPLEFKSQWTCSLRKWRTATIRKRGPTLYRCFLKINATPLDTYVDMRNWIKGIVIVNGFVLSRYMKVGPQLAIYLPAPFLRRGMNEIMIFEHFDGAKYVHFLSSPLYENVASKNILSISISLIFPFAAGLFAFLYY